VNLGWRRDEFSRVADERGPTLGRFDRYATDELDALAGDDRAEQLRADRMLIAHRAAGTSRSA
jgi:hypothetical protein